MPEFAPMMSIALFGTSGDPPTAGHRKILTWLSQRFTWVAVWAADNPFKLHQTPLEHRAAMLQLLIEEIDSPRHNIGIYQELSSPRTLLTVEHARQRWPEAALTLVIGSDLVSQLPKWYRAADLLRQVKLLVIPRPGYQLEEADLVEIRQFGAEVAIADLTGLDVSSTAYRERGDTEALTPPIEAYIHRERLYACQDASKKRLPIR